MVYGRNMEERAQDAIGLSSSDITQKSEIVGDAIRQLRKSRGLTVRELGARIERSGSYISQIERNLAKPTLNDLFAIANALGVTATWFLQDVTPVNANEQGIIVRHDKRRHMEKDGIISELLSMKLGEKAECMITTYRPDAGTDFKKVKNKPGTEIGVVLRGRIELWIEQDCFVLEAGDSYTVDHSWTYCTHNPSTDEDAVIVWICVYD